MARKMHQQKANKPSSSRQNILHEIIFEADTPAGKLFDVLLLWAILISVVVVLIESVAGVKETHGILLKRLEWGFTILFTVEYIFRLISVRNPFRYARSFFGLVDLLSILPTYLSLLIVETHSLLVIRVLRLLRVFRIFKLGRFVSEGNVLMAALRASRTKITIFIGTVFTLVLVLGTAMYLIEGEANGFTNIPKSVYWAVVTMTTVGYGDITPQTILGRILASLVMVLGYAIIAIPTGIVSVELAQANKLALNTQSCPNCSKEGHADDAIFCRFCSSKL